MEGGLCGPTSWEGQGLRELPGQSDLCVNQKTQTWWSSASAHQEKEELNKVTMDSANTFVWKKNPSSALTQKPDNSIPPLMFWALFKLLLQCWS